MNQPNLEGAATMPYRHLSQYERYVIFFLNMMDMSNAEIGRRLLRSRSTISRELRRNRNLADQYLYDYAHRTMLQRRRQRIPRVTGNAKLMQYVTRRIISGWSPEQIAGRLNVSPPSELRGMSITHTTIYRWIWADVGRAERLKTYLRVAHKPRRKPYGKPSKRGQIPNRVSIDERPEIVNKRTRIGDWEADTVVGSGRSGCVMTCVDRTSRYLVARKLDRATADATSNALYDSMRRMPAARRRTVTVDNGREFARHEKLAKRLGVDVYFAHPYSSWERGTNENTNGLLRQYLPKKSSFEMLTNRELAKYTWQLNNRPRKCLNYKTPAEVFHNRLVALQM